jgi:ABC-type branched-subunit amino acid transport system ATPase component
VSALLDLEKVTIKFGGLTAVSECDMQVGEDELAGLIGPNGAGKTTVFNLITGVYQPTSGRITSGRNHCRREATRSLTPRDFAHLPECAALRADDRLR